MKIICCMCLDAMNPFDVNDDCIEGRINQHTNKHNRKGKNGVPSQRDGHITNNSTQQGMSPSNTNQVLATTTPQLNSQTGQQANINYTNQYQNLKY